MPETYDSQMGKGINDTTLDQLMREDPTMPDNLAWPTPSEGLKRLTNSRTGVSSAHSRHPTPYGLHPHQTACGSAGRGGGDKIQPATKRT